MTSTSGSPAAEAQVTFVDTNVLVYAHDAADPVRQRVARDLLDELWETRSGRLSTQVLQEFYAVATRKFRPSMPPATAREVVHAYAPWVAASPDVALILAASELEERLRLSFWDAMILEAARRAGAKQLATEDMATGSTLAGVRPYNPFA